VVLDSGDPGYNTRILMATPTRGLVRIEWHAAIRGLMIPPNWSMVSMTQFVNDFYPVRFSVADAQNLVVREVMERGFEWVLFMEDDTIPPVDLFIKLDKYMREGPPVVSGLYYTKGQPSEPLVYRGRGNGAFLDWKKGDKVWCDGVPTGCLLVHSSLLKVMWNDSRPYTINGNATREIFVTPMKQWVSPEGDVNTMTGTSDLNWCDRVIEGGYLKKAGWDKIARKKYPFLIDTSIECKHISLDGQVFPP
jgi:hypothetical protein